MMRRNLAMRRPKGNGDNCSRPVNQSLRIGLPPSCRRGCFRLPAGWSGRPREGNKSLHAYSTRAQHNHHHRRGKTAAAVVAVLVFVAIATVYGPSLARSAQPSGIELTSAPEAEVLGAEARPGHDLAIEIVAPGREGLELSARLTDDGGLIELPMHWTIRNMNGETVYSGSTPGADIQHTARRLRRGYPL